MSGEIRVETAQFDVASANLRRIADEITSIHGRLSVERWHPDGAEHTPVNFLIGLAAVEAELGVLGLSGIAGLAGMVSDHLRQAQIWYERADQAVVNCVAMISDSIIGTVAEGIRIAAVASVMSAVALLGTPAGIVTLGSAALGATILIDTGVIPDPETAFAYLAENAHVLATPETVMFLRSLVSAGDEILTVDPFPLGTVGNGKNPTELAGTITALGGALTGGGVLNVSATRRQPVDTAPGSIADLTATIPDTEEHGAHASITEYRREDGSTVYLVSVAGTSSAEFGGESGMDNLSNLAAYAGMDQQSLGAVRDAMAEAGIGEGDDVVFTGYSQGALIATQLASSGDWDTQSVVLAGTPVHGNAVGGDVPVVQLEHDGDLITGLQGWVAPAAGGVAVVRRNPYPDGVTAQAGVLGPHTLTNYRETAAMYDRVDDASAVQRRDAVVAPFAGATAVTTTDFRFTRG